MLPAICNPAWTRKLPLKEPSTPTLLQACLYNDSTTLNNHSSLTCFRTKAHPIPPLKQNQKLSSYLPMESTNHQSIVLINIGVIRSVTMPITTSPTNFTSLHFSWWYPSLSILHLADQLSNHALVYQVTSDIHTSLTVSASSKLFLTRAKPLLKIFSPLTHHTIP